MGSPCSDGWEVQYSGSGFKKQEVARPFFTDNDIQAIAEKKGPTMLRAILTAATLLCASHAAFAQEMTSAQRDACMGDYEKYCKSVAPGGGRIIACLAKESDKLTPACKKVLAAAEKK
jgi:Cysteine rich repeat